jgi:hypothetical protein
MQYPFAACLVTLAVCACAAQAQNMVPTFATPYTSSWTVSTNRMAGPPVTGVPYSAEQVFERVQVLPDGTRITDNRPASTTTYRDSQGRVRTERKMFGTDSPVVVEITDPIAGVGYALDDAAKVAHKFTLRERTPAQSGPVGTMAGGGGGGAAVAGVLGGVIGPPPSAPAVQTKVDPATAATSNGTSVSHPRPQTESLGTQTMEGIPVTGHRTTTTFPVGSVGNDREFSSYTENWFSPDLRLMVMTKTVDPRSGENTMRLINVSRNEPDPSLFQPPASYSVVEETGPTFTIQYPRQAQ